MLIFVEFLRFLWRTTRWKMVGVIAFSVLLSLTEGVSLALIFPLIALLGDPLQPAGHAGPRTERLLHLLAASHLPQRGWLPAMLVVLLVSVWALNSLTAALNTLTIGTILRVREQTAVELYAAMLEADWSFVSNRRSSTLTHLLTGELDRTGMLAGVVTAFFSSGLVALLMVGVALYLSPLLTLVVVASFAALLPWQRRVGRTVYGAGKKVSTMSEELAALSVERLQHLKAIKAYGAQAAERSLFARRMGAVTAEMTAMEWRGTTASRRFQTLSMLVLCGVILLGLGPLHLTAGAMLIFLFAFLRASPRLNVLQVKGNGLLADLPAFGNIHAFLLECRAHRDQGATGAVAPELRRELKLAGVRFGYPGGDEVLKGVDLTLYAGEITAVSGESGAGKSTLADLVMGMLVAQLGTIAADGVAITQENAQAWRGRVGYVSQDTLLFHETIRENLLWARPGATEGELAEAIGAASAQFCYALPQGLETLAGDRGTMLSHGQRQRLALARAFLLKPSLLILDEATNSLDLDNEAAILRTVRAAGMTTLLISHRPSAVAGADRVFLLVGGVVVGRRLEETYPTITAVKLR